MSICRKGLVSIALLWYGAALAGMLEAERRAGWEPFQKNLKYLLFCALLCGQPGRRLAAAVLRHRSTALVGSRRGTPRGERLPAPTRANLDARVL